MPTHSSYLLFFYQAADIAVCAIEAAVGSRAYFVDDVAGVLFADVLRELDTLVRVIAGRDDAHTQARALAEAFEDYTGAGAGRSFQRSWRGRSDDWRGFDLNCLGQRAGLGRLNGRLADINAGQEAFSGNDVDAFVKVLHRKSRAAAGAEFPQALAVFGKAVD